MWEDATPNPPAPAPPAKDVPPAGPAHARPAPGGDRVLLTQAVLCALLLAAVLGARALGLPLFAQLRVAYTAALQQDSGLLAEERQFTRFAQQSLAVLQQAAREALALLRGPAQPVAAPPAGVELATVAAGARPTAARQRRANGKAAPEGSSLQGYRPPFALARPLGGAAYTLSSAFGWRTEPVSGSGADFHTGADMAVGEGTPVLAAAGGVVRATGSGGSYGNYVRILHPGGDETLYAHMQYLFVHAGQSVAMGEQLGTVGQTGHATGPHLHFELLHQGVRYDPSLALQAAR